MSRLTFKLGLKPSSISQNKFKQAKPNGIKFLQFIYVHNLEFEYYTQ